MKANKIWLRMALVMLSLVCIATNIQAAQTTINLKCNVGGLSIYAADDDSVFLHSSYKGTTQKGTYVGIYLDIPSITFYETNRVLLKSGDQTVCSFYLIINQYGKIYEVFDGSGCSISNQGDYSVNVDTSASYGVKKANGETCSQANNYDTSCQSGYCNGYICVPGPTYCGNTHATGTNRYNTHQATYTGWTCTNGQWRKA